MYTLVRQAWSRQGLLTEAPALVASLAVAEIFYKFHSFLLECSAFLVTWLAISYVVTRAADGLSIRRSAGV